MAGNCQEIPVTAPSRANAKAVLLIVEVNPFDKAGKNFTRFVSLRRDLAKQIISSRTNPLAAS
jgi:hypothetical protein